MELVIFGAQGIALATYQALRNLYPERKVICFLVSQMENNPFALEGVPVVQLDKFSQCLSQNEKDKIQILIATPENVMGDIEIARSVTLKPIEEVAKKVGITF